MSEVIANLRDALVVLYPEVDSAKRVADDAAVKWSNANLQSAVINVWHSILQEAVKSNRIDQLVEVVQGEYASNQHWQDGGCKIECVTGLPPVK
jgi:hypothetical protein